MTDFLIVGLHNSPAYNNIFPLFMKRKIDYGYAEIHKFEGSDKVLRCSWFQNLCFREVPDFQFHKTYKEGDYRKFDFFDAINIDRVDDIPDGYYGLMGVPITFLRMLNREQFDFLGVAHSGTVEGDLFIPLVEGVYRYIRLIIRRKDYGKKQQ